MKAEMRKVVAEQPDPSSELQALYDEHYYATSCGPVPYDRTEHWVNFFAIVCRSDCPFPSA